jgi:hypothetical protein
MIVIALLEGVGLIFGYGVSSFLETLIPEIDIEADVTNTPNTITRLLGWLRVGKVPVLMLLIIFLTAFGLLGVAIQLILVNSFGVLLPTLVAIIPAFFVSLPVVRISCVLLSKIMPKDETDAVSSDTFIGRIATVTLGEAKKGNAAQAKLTDKFGHTHYLMIEPDNADETFLSGTSVLIVKKQGSLFLAIRNENLSLVD